MHTHIKRGTEEGIIFFFPVNHLIYKDVYKRLFILQKSMCVQVIHVIKLKVAVEEWETFLMLLLV